MLDEIVTPDVFIASKPLCSITSLMRDNGSPLNFSLVNLGGYVANNNACHFAFNAGKPCGLIHSHLN